VKKTTPVDAQINDNDIAQVFASQSVRVPESVRDSILEQANLSGTGRERVQAGTLRTRGLGIAAALLIAAIIVPAVMQEPESSLDIQDLGIPDPDITKTAAPMQQQAADIMNNEEASVNTQEIRTTMTRESTVSSAPSPTYRNSADKWMNEIKVLITTGEAQQARDEYQLFAQQHPTQAKDFKPEFDKQPLVDELPANDQR